MAPAVERKSLVNDFEVALTQLGVERGTPNDQKARLLFDILDDVVPKLGVYTQIMDIIRQELYESVFSDQLTTVADREGPQRVPYFALLGRMDERNENRVQRHEEQIEDLRNRLFSKHTDYEDSLLTMTEFKNDINELETEISELKSLIAEKDKDIQNLNDQSRYEFERTENVRISLKNHIKEIKDDLHEANDEIKFLYKYKDAYDELQEAFDGKPEPKVTRKKHPTLATKRAHLLSDIEQSYKLEEQLLSIENITIEDYDQLIEEQKTALFDGETDQFETLDKIEFGAKHSRFRKNIDDLNTELDLLQAHRFMLEEELGIIEQASVEKRRAERRKRQKRIKEPELLEGLEIEMDEVLGSDTFEVRQRVFSKYSAMIYTSTDGGKTFLELKTAAYCSSCGLKTVLCPHRIANKDQIFQAPSSTTHIKVVRPEIRINREDIDPSLKTVQIPSRQSSALADYRKSSPAAAGDARKSQSPLAADSKTEDELEFSEESSSVGQPSSQQSKEEDLYSPSQGTPSSSEVVRMKYPLSLMWDDYRSRTDLVRQVPRTLTSKRTVALLEQFLAYTLCQDEQIAEGNDDYHCFIENLYYFLIRRYGKEDVGFLVAHDLFAALNDFSTSDKFIQVFSHCLIGNLDATVIRYVLVLADFVAGVDWRRVEDFRHFTTAIYPFATEDDIESLHMGYVSFARNKISSQLVMDYLLYLVLRFREPRLQEFEGKLTVFVTQKADNMTCQEYLDSLDAILSLPDDGISQRLYKEAEGTVMLIEGDENSVPIQKIGHIAGYLSVLEVLSVMKKSIATKIAEGREQSEIDQPRVKPSEGSSDLMTYSKIKNLAANLNSLMQV